MARGNITSRRDADDGMELTFTDESINKIARYNGTKADKTKAGENRVMAARNAPRNIFGIPTTTPTTEDIMAGYETSPQGRAAAAKAKTTATTKKKLAPVFLAEKAVGQDVSILQDFLYEQGFYKGRSDGDFGPQTTAAVKAFQKDRGLYPDGLVGDDTMTELREVQMAANAEAARKYAAEQSAPAPAGDSGPITTTRFRADGVTPEEIVEVVTHDSPEFEALSQANLSDAAINDMYDRGLLEGYARDLLLGSSLEKLSAYFADDPNAPALGMFSRFNAKPTNLR